MLPDWEIWLDNHLSPIIAKWLKDEFGFEVKSSYSLQLERLNDYEIYNKAKDQKNVIIISKDSDLEPDCQPVWFSSQINRFKS